MGLVRFYVVIVLFAPLLWGAVYPWTTAVWLLMLAAIAMRLPGEWFRGPKFTTLSLYSIVIAFIVVIVLQVLPGTFSIIPNSIWSLSAQALESKINERVAADLSSLIWELGTVALYALAFWSALAIGSDRHRATTFLKWAVWGTAILVASTLTLYFADERFLLWEKRIHYLGSFTHGFVNRNTAASFLGTFLLVSLGLLIRSWRNLRLSWNRFSPHMFDEALPDLIKQVLPYIIATSVFSVGLLQTGSRAGILFTGVSIIFLIVLLFAKSKAGRFSKITGILVLLGLLLWSFSNWGDKVSARIDAQGLELTGRSDAYSATIEMIKDYPLLGLGLGSFTSTFPVYKPPTLQADQFWDKAHNTYLEVTAEMGIPFAILLALFWVGLFIVLMHGYFTRKRRYVLPAIGASCWLLASLHSFVDFSLQIPGQAIALAAILGVCLAQTYRQGRN